MDNPEKLAALSTQDSRRRQTKQKTQHKQIKSWETRTPPKQGWSQASAKRKQILTLIRYPPCYS